MQGGRKCRSAVMNGKKQQQQEQSDCRDSKQQLHTRSVESWEGSSVRRQVVGRARTTVWRVGVVSSLFLGHWRRRQQHFKGQRRRNHG
ncbi:hypothetical protein NL676_035110 [Syzygium grande]|nr:hypothetical protein NL676_035110 [Syzygium grande]